MCHFVEKCPDTMRKQRNNNKTPGHSPGGGPCCHFNNSNPAFTSKGVSNFPDLCPSLILSPSLFLAFSALSVSLFPLLFRSLVFSLRFDFLFSSRPHQYLQLPHCSLHGNGNNSPAATAAMACMCWFVASHELICPLR